MRKYLLMLGASIALAIPLAAVTDAAARDYRINSWKNDPSCAEAKEKLAKGELMSSVACQAAGTDSCFLTCTPDAGGAISRPNNNKRACAEANPSNCLTAECTVKVYHGFPCGPSTFSYEYNEIRRHCGLPTYGSGGAGE